MSELFKPLYHDTDSITVSKSIAEQNRKHLRSMLNAQYGTMVTHYKENDMRIKDFIVLHSDTQPLMIKKDSITSLSRLADGTARVETTNQIWITDDKYQDVVKKLFEV